MSDLALAVRVNEDVKHIVDASRQINIVALNALLTARQAGVRSRGFAVVSRELRGLSGQLETAMLSLDELISQLTHDLAQSLRDRRLITSIELAVAEPDPHPCIWDALTRAMSKHDSIEAAIVVDWQHLDQALKVAQRLIAMGGPLARSAKIEAAYGGGMAPVLRHVAEQVDMTVTQIVERLRKIHGIIDRGAQ